MSDERVRRDRWRGDDGALRVSRRRIMQLSVVAGLGIAGVSSLAAAVRLVPRIVVTPGQDPPAKGDLLVVAQGELMGRVLKPEDVPVNGPQVFAWPMAPSSHVIRSANTHNLLVLVRAADKGWYRVPAGTAQNVAAYSAICTHLCCTVSDWRAGPSAPLDRGALFCPCHLSRFDPWNGARVLSGPAPRSLPALPLATDGQGRLIVAGEFSAEVGCAT